jgi:hypothetical protein
MELSLDRFKEASLITASYLTMYMWVPDEACQLELLGRALQKRLPAGAAAAATASIAGCVTSRADPSGPAASCLRAAVPQGYNGHPGAFAGQGEVAGKGVPQKGVPGPNTHVPANTHAAGQSIASLTL